MSEQQKNRLFELLSDDALAGLSGEEAMELNRLKKQFPEWENDLSVEMAAAAIGLSNLDRAETLPANLRAKILSDAESYFRSAAGTPDEANRTGETRENFVQVETSKPSFFGRWLGWAVAAAACAALAVNLWMTHSRPQTETVRDQETVKTPEIARTPTPNVELSAARQREQLIASATDLVKTDLSAARVKSLEKLSGDVVWSNARQKGFVRLHNLPRNDALKETYQLWIVDAGQNEKTPVSGGVFDVGEETGEIIVPIDAQLEIKQPKAFAVSREKPGGVVVSSPQRFVAIGEI